MTSSTASPTYRISRETHPAILATELPNVVAIMDQKNVVAAALGAHSTCHKTRYGGRDISGAKARVRGLSGTGASVLGTRSAREGKLHIPRDLGLVLILDRYCRFSNAVSKTAPADSTWLLRYRSGNLEKDGAAQKKMRTNQKRIASTNPEKTI